MDEKEWLRCNGPKKMLHFLRGGAGDRKLRLLAVAICRSVWGDLPSEGRRAVEVAERYADRRASEAELATVRRAVLEVSTGHDFNPPPEQGNALASAYRACVMEALYEQVYLVLDYVG